MKATIFLSLATLCLLYFATPQYDVLLHTLGNWRIYNNIQHKLLPKDRWFPLQR